LLQLTNIDEWTIAEIHERLGEPQKQDLHQSKKEDGISSPRYTVNAISMKMVNPKWLSDTIMIIDFGIAFLEDQGSTDIGTPKNYCAPEFQFGRPRSKYSDIWALGCTIFEIRTGCCLFLFHGPPDRERILLEVVKTLGRLPEEWWKGWENGRSWYNLEIQPEGKLVDMVKGNLAQQIVAMGLHDGDIKPSHSSHGDMGFKKDVLRTIEERLPSPSALHQNQTDKLIALVEELTTSEAADVIVRINKDSGSSDEKSEEKSGSGSGSSRQHESGSGSSNNKSGKSMISSEGIETKTNMVTITGSEEHKVHGLAGLPGRSTTVKELLESAGTTISPIEAGKLEDLLRKTMALVPEERVAAADLVKHSWFVDTYEVDS
jgi:serine/threonine-protein kinase SRPK3